MEKRKRNRRERRNRLFKISVILALLCISGYAIKVVNQTIVEMGELENPNIFKLSLGDRKMILFGKSYYIDLKILKESD